MRFGDRSSRLGPESGVPDDWGLRMEPEGVIDREALTARLKANPDANLVLVNCEAPYF